MRVICFTGYPLSGKSTIARVVASEMEAGLFSTGELARALGMGVEESVATHDMSFKLDAEITARAVEAALAGKVLDGFPRSVAQVAALRNAGVEFKVVFVTENPLTVYDRVNVRAKEQGRPEDTADVVAGRLRRSMEFKRELEAVLFPYEMLVWRGGDGSRELLAELER
jgi:adenylate kinase family enzyme